MAEAQRGCSQERRPLPHHQEAGLGLSPSSQPCECWGHREDRLTGRGHTQLGARGSGAPRASAALSGRWGTQMPVSQSGRMCWDDSWQVHGRAIRIMVIAATMQLSKAVCPPPPAAQPPCSPADPPSHKHPTLPSSSMGATAGQPGMPFSGIPPRSPHASWPAALVLGVVTRSSCLPRTCGISAPRGRIVGWGQTRLWE